MDWRYVHLLLWCLSSTGLFFPLFNSLNILIFNEFYLNNRRKMSSIKIFRGGGYNGEDRPLNCPTDQTLNYLKNKSQIEMLDTRDFGGNKKRTGPFLRGTLFATLTSKMRLAKVWCAWETLDYRAAPKLWPFPVRNVKALKKQRIWISL